MDDQNLTPQIIKEELDRYVIGQDEAKKSCGNSSTKSLETFKC